MPQLQLGDDQRMDIDPKFAADLKNQLDAQSIQLPWQDLEIAETFWHAVDGLTLDQAVKVAKAVRAGIENGVIATRNPTT